MFESSVSARRFSAGQFLLGGKMKELITIIYQLMVSFPWEEIVPFVLFAGAVCILRRIFMEVRKL